MDGGGDLLRRGPRGPMELGADGGLVPARGGSLCDLGAALAPLRPVLLATVLVFVGWWLSLTPSHDRQWDASVAVLPRAVRRDDVVTIENVRNNEYRSFDDFTARYETRSYRLENLKAADIIFFYWGSPWMSHPVLVFDFGPDGRVCISIEVRYRKGQCYSVLRSLYRQQELIYLVVDERDAILRRTKHDRIEGYLYRLNEDAGRLRTAFLDYVAAINDVYDKPRWYHALCANCTTSFYRLPNSQRRCDWRVIVNGRLDRASTRQAGWIVHCHLRYSDELATLMKLPSWRPRRDSAITSVVKSKGFIMGDDIIAPLKAHEYFSGISDETLREIGSIARVSSYAAGAVVHQFDEPLTSICFVLRGRLKAVRVDAYGHEHFFRMFQRGEQYGIMLGGLGEPLPVRIFAMEASTILSLDHEASMEFMFQHPHVRRQWFHAYAQRAAAPLRNHPQACAPCTCVASRIPRHAEPRSQARPATARVGRRDLRAQRRGHVAVDAGYAVSFAVRRGRPSGYDGNPPTSC